MWDLGQSFSFFLSFLIFSFLYCICLFLVSMCSSRFNFPLWGMLVYWSAYHPQIGRYLGILCPQAFVSVSCTLLTHGKVFPSTSPGNQKPNDERIYGLQVVGRMGKAKQGEFWNLTDLVPISFTLQLCGPPGEWHYPLQASGAWSIKKQTITQDLLLWDNARERSRYGVFIKL